jgi:putative addiction module component (TIGR02574 family)
VEKSTPTQRSAIVEAKDIVEKAIELTPAERARIIDALLRSLDRPDPHVDRVWADEAEARLAAVREGRMPTVPAEQVVGPR